MRHYVAVLVPQAEKSWRVHFPDFPGCRAEGETVAAAVAASRHAAAGRVRELHAQGVSLPQPRSYEDIRNHTDGWAADRGIDWSTAVITEIALPLDGLFGKSVDAMAEALAVRTQELHEKCEELQASEQRLDTLANHAPALLWFNGAQGAEFVNRAYLEFLGVGDVDVRGYDWAQFVHPEDRTRYIGEYEAAVAQGAAFEAEFRFRRHDGQYRWMRSIGTPRYAADRKLIGYVGTTIDVTERREAEEQQRLLTREVDHRSKNLLTVVLSILKLSNAPDVPTYVELVTGRVMAMARANNLLSASRWQSADLKSLVRVELAPYGTNASRIVVDGPTVNLTPAASQSLALALHELATNTAKHGALSHPRGKLAVRWELDSDGITLIWIETGGPAPPQLPTREGFGTTILTASIEGQLQGRITRDWLPEGLCATIWLPLAHSSDGLATGA